MQLAGGRLRDAQALDTLSGRERQVLDLLARGQSNAAIAAELGLTEATVKSYVSALLTKLGVANRVQAALFVQRARVVRRERVGAPVLARSGSRSVGRPLSSSCRTRRGGRWPSRSR